MALSLKIDFRAKVRDALGERCAGLFDECAEHVAHESVLVLTTEVRRQQSDLNVTIAGGTTINLEARLRSRLGVWRTSTELGRVKWRKAMALAISSPL